MPRTLRRTDHTLALVRKGYRFSEWVRSRTTGPGPGTSLRLLGRRTLLVRGREGVELFYDAERVTRQQALPGAFLHTLYGRDAVHGLDGEEHQHRKQFFLRVTEPARVAMLVDLATERWEREMDTWVRHGHGAVLDSAVAAFGEAVQVWAGVPDDPATMLQRSRDLHQIVDGVGTPSRSWFLARRARSRAEAWATRLVQQVRAGDRLPGPGTAASVMAHATDPSGRLLPDAVAAVELLNVLRPTVAVAYLAAHAALELEANPDLADECAGGDPAAVTAFAHEVRRLAPFVPLLAARASCPFHWGGSEVRAGDRVLLDVYGSLHDRRTWRDATTFDPGRFRGGAEGRTDFVPQGGGPVETGHRCPGEGIAIGLLGVVIPRLAALDWHIHPDDRRVSLRRVPARAPGGVRLLDVRPAYELSGA